MDLYAPSLGSSRFWGPVFGAHLSAAVSTSNSLDIEATFFSAWDSSILRGGPRWPTALAGEDAKAR